jgi:hypothetical protein
MKIDTLITFTADYIGLTREDAVLLIKACPINRSPTLDRLVNFVNGVTGKSLLHLSRNDAREYLQTLIR